MCYWHWISLINLSLPLIFLDGKRGEGIYRGIATFVEQQASILENLLRDELRESH